MGAMSRRSAAAPILFALLFASVCASVCAPGAAGATEAENISKAREIALTAADDLDASRFADALEKVGKAEALYHAPTHLLIMADALVGLGRLAEALEVYEKLAAEPLAQTAPPAFLKARQEGNQKQRALLARVPALLVDITGAPIEQTKATLDGRPFALESGLATRVDPGKHTLHVEASGFVPQNRELSFAERGGVVKITLRLEVASAHIDPRPLQAPAIDQKAKTRSLFVPAMISFGIGAATLAAGAVTGVMSFDRVKKLETRCTEAGRCPPDAAPLMDNARFFGNVSTAAFVVSGVAISAGIVLLVFNNPKKPEKASLVMPYAAFSDQGSALGVWGRF